MGNSARIYSAAEMIEQLRPGQFAYNANDSERKNPYWRTHRGIMYQNKRGQETFATLLTVFLEGKYIIINPPIKSTYAEAIAAAKEGKKVKPIGRKNFLTYKQLQGTFFSIMEINGEWEIIDG